jgi:uncharacterized surface protein with fasciclin (FAS1) repeats
MEEYTMRTTRLTALTAAAVFSIPLAACGGNSGSDTSTSGAGEPAAAPMRSTAVPMPSTIDAMANFGAGCAAVPTDASDKGSFQAMAQVPVATAASGNPLLSTLVSAIKQAGLVDSLNSANGITVFAPTNDAFKKIPAATLKKVLADKKTLTSILTYHVVPGELTAADLAGSHTTLQGGDLTVSGTGEDFMVNGTAGVVCGNVQTENANVYIVDSVLMPKK